MDTWGLQAGRPSSGSAMDGHRGLLPTWSSGFLASHMEWPWYHFSLTINEGRLPKAPGLEGSQATGIQATGLQRKERTLQLFRGNVRDTTQRSTCPAEASQAGMHQQWCRRSQVSSLETHLEREGPQSRDGDERGHEESSDVADGREGHAGSRALEALPGPVLRTRRHSAESRRAGFP